jgi:hypothetical protein
MSPIGGVVLTALIVVPGAIGLAPKRQQTTRTLPPLERPTPKVIAQQPASIPIESAYGTLAFRGTIRRAELETEYEFRVDLTVTFRPDEPVNRVPMVAIEACLLRATMPADRPGQPVTVLFERRQPVSVRLTDAGETKAMPRLIFRMPKSAAARATMVGLVVTDGRILWPITVGLK